MIPKPKINLIATLPKSGTWYSHTFFWYYTELLRHSDEFLAGSFQPDLEAILQERKLTQETHHSDTLGIDKLYILHSTCPGFHDLNDVRYALWQTLHFPNAGYNQGEAYFADASATELLDPHTNSDARIIYLYRNPLDHFISYYHHTLKHKDEGHRLKTLANGSTTPIIDLRDFVFQYSALGAFIKHFYSFKQMQQKYPANVLMMSYENLTRNPTEGFGKILEFMDAPPNTPAKQMMLDEALKNCSKESLSAIENKLNLALAGDQTGNEKHIRDGAIGKWQQQLNDEDIAMIEAALNIFSISLNDFQLVIEKDTLSLPETSPSTKQLYQAEFIRHQAQLSSTSATMGLMQHYTEVINLIKSMKSSLSWRITTPLRTVITFLNNRFFQR